MVRSARRQPVRRRLHLTARQRTGGRPPSWRRALCRAAYGRDYAEHWLVFARPDGQPWRPSWVSREFKRLLEESGDADGLERVPSLTGAALVDGDRADEQGAALEVISKVTRHTDSGVTRSTIWRSLRS